MKYKATYSNQNKFIWFQVNKAASSSIYHALIQNAKLVPNEDYFEHIDFLNKKKKYPELNKYSATDDFPPDLVKLMRPLYEHQVDNETLNTLKFKKTYFSFSFVRNPWSRLVSYYNAGFKNKNTTSFSEYLKEITKTENLYSHPHYKPQTSCIPPNTLDFIGKVENFDKDFNSICNNINIPQQTSIHLNKSKHKHYTEYYDRKDRDLIAEVYKDDIEMFGYKFED